MPKKFPHISIDNKTLFFRIFPHISEQEYRTWPESVQELAASLATELFIIRYNPLIPPEQVFQSVTNQLAAERPGLGVEHFQIIRNGLNAFWKNFQDDQEFKDELINRLREIIPREHIITRPTALVECSTDATDLRMELPLLVVAPGTTEEVRQIVHLANELSFGIIPRGGGSGLTGGAVPAFPRSVVLSLSRMKKIIEINTEKMLLCAQAGVITLNAIQEVQKKGLLFTVDPASKASSSLGGNIAENAGGPFAFEYGTTLDNIYSYKMVLPSGKLIEVKRKGHPWHKILPQEPACFEIRNEQGELEQEIKIQGEEIRAKGLGKDVSNKYLGGLPGIQKEGVDGIITEACFTLHEQLRYSQTICLEFYGHTMRNAMLVIKDLVKMRDKIRNQGDLVKLSALEEFGSKYVQAIEYNKKSSKFEGDPISVLLVQIDSNDQKALDKASEEIKAIAASHQLVDIFVAQDEMEAELFWHDRHKLSAISKRTSGFKINEDVVIPIEVIPEFSNFIENLNLYYLALAYRQGLQKATQVKGVDPGDEFITMEINFSTKILKGKITAEMLSEQEFQLQIHYFFRDLGARYPKQKEKIAKIEQDILNNRIIIANHMHAGDGNCHVNIPVNSNDPEMLTLAEEAAEKVFSQVLQLRGSVSGEHGIGITKIKFLSPEKVSRLKKYKQQVDPKGIFNPGKLVQDKVPVTPYTFSFNRLILDIDKTALPNKEKLIPLLRNIQTCTRCGKCKQVCPMYHPEMGFLYHPRNKIISLGALVEASYYTQLNLGTPNPVLIKQLQEMLEFCTGCGKCYAICPVKINTGEQVLGLRAFLEERDFPAHPIKNKVLHFLTKHQDKIAPTAKALALGQGVQSAAVSLLPKSWRSKMTNPILMSKGPKLGLKNFWEIIAPKESAAILYPPGNSPKEMVFYFPGCGSGLFYADIALAAVYLLLKAKIGIIIPPQHLCCGYPLLAAGLSKDFAENKGRNRQIIQSLLEQAAKAGKTPNFILTSCGTCREGLSSYGLTKPSANIALDQKDVLQYLIERRQTTNFFLNAPVLFHGSCHAAWDGLPADKSAQLQAKELEKLLQNKVKISPGCCGESGLGALTSPAIYNTIRKRKTWQLKQELVESPPKTQVLVACPSCKVGLERIFRDNGLPFNVLHVLELLAELTGGKKWKKELSTLLLSAPSPGNNDQ